MTDIAIKVENVSKLYSIGVKKTGNFREDFIDSFLGFFNSEKEEGSELWALDNVSFDVKQGEVLGILGHNGGGKSTLLKLISKITFPTKGRIEIFGRVSSLLEVGTGFHPELTGRENIFLNGTILGMTRQEIKKKFDEIVDFSGIEKFIDTPVKRYSSGMYVRLAFAVAAHLEPEILIIDEVLAVGDAEFQKKCLGKMKDVAQSGRTILFVSHNITAIRNLCSKAIVLNKGVKIGEGPVSEQIELYDRKINSLGKRDDGVFKLNEEIEIKDFKFNPNPVKTGAKVNFSFVLFSKTDICISYINLLLFSADEIRLSLIDLRTESIQIVEKDNSLFIEGEIKELVLTEGNYSLGFHLDSDKLRTHIYHVHDFSVYGTNKASVGIAHDPRGRGFIEFDYSFKVSKLKSG